MSSNMKINIIVLGFMLIYVSAAVAERPFPMHLPSCREDIDSLCNTTRKPLKMLCLADNLKKLDPDCKKEVTLHPLYGCVKDIEKHCGEELEDKPKMSRHELLDCLKSNVGKLSDKCATILKPTPGKTCKKEINKFCNGDDLDVKQKFECLEEHKKEISSECRREMRRLLLRQFIVKNKDEEVAVHEPQL